MQRVTVATYNSKADADLAVARLQSEGIDAMAVTDSAGGIEPQLDLIRGVRVMVWEADAFDAAETLEDVSPPGPVGEDWEPEGWSETTGNTDMPWLVPVAWIILLLVIAGIASGVLRMF